MGTIRNQAVLVTSYSEVSIDEFRDTLPDQWKPLCIGPVPSLVNGDYHYVWLPDGSKEGWETSDAGNIYRAAFVSFLKEHLVGDVPYMKILNIEYGDDEASLSEEIFKGEHKHIER